MQKNKIVFLPWPEVERRINLSRPTIERMMAMKEFPKKVQISRRNVAWIESDVVAWQESKIRARDKAAGWKDG